MPTREFHIRIALPRFTHRHSAIAITLLLTVSAAIYAAAPLSLYIPQKNDPLKASNIAQNFTDIQTAVNALQNARPALKDGQGNVLQYLDAKFVGVTASTYDGDLMAVDANAPNGYAAAKALCKIAFNTTTVHMCTAEEIARHLTAGGAMLPSEGWVSTAMYVIFQWNTSTQDDCRGWTVNANTDLGPTFAGISPDNEYCSSKRPIACCD